MKSVIGTMYLGFSLAVQCRAQSHYSSYAASGTGGGRLSASLLYLQDGTLTQAFWTSYSVPSRMSVGIKPSLFVARMVDLRLLF